jgi:hypothetical protein
LQIDDLRSSTAPTAHFTASLYTGGPSTSASAPYCKTVRSSQPTLAMRVSDPLRNCADRLISAVSHLPGAVVPGLKAGLGRLRRRVLKDGWKEK